MLTIFCLDSKKKCCIFIIMTALLYEYSASIRKKNKIKLFPPVFPHQILWKYTKVRLMAVESHKRLNTRVGKKLMDISDMASFTGVQHLCTFNIEAYLIYHLLPNVWKASYTISASIFVDVPYWPPYSTNKLISCVVQSVSQWYFLFGE